MTTLLVPAVTTVPETVASDPGAIVELPITTPPPDALTIDWPPTSTGVWAGV